MSGTSAEFARASGGNGEAAARGSPSGLLRASDDPFQSKGSQATRVGTYRPKSARRVRFIPRAATYRPAYDLIGVKSV